MYSFFNWQPDPIADEYNAHASMVIGMVNGLIAALGGAIICSKKGPSRTVAIGALIMFISLAGYCNGLAYYQGAQDALTQHRRR